MKLLCLCSALDLQLRLGCSPAYWQMLKGLYELGHDVIAVPYLGKAFEPPYWRAYPNPCDIEGRLFSGMPGRLEESLGIPTLTINGDLNDLRLYSEEQSRTAIEAFVEQLGQ